MTDDKKRRAHNDQQKKYYDSHKFYSKKYHLKSPAQLYEEHKELCLLIVGTSGSGNTNLLMHLLVKSLVYYDKIILYAKNLEQHYYQELTRRFEKIAEKLGADIEGLLQVSKSRSR